MTVLLSLTAHRRTAALKPNSKALTGSYPTISMRAGAQRFWSADVLEQATLYRLFLLGELPSSDVGVGKEGLTFAFSGKLRRIRLLPLPQNIRNPIVFVR